MSAKEDQKRKSVEEFNKIALDVSKRFNDINHASIIIAVDAYGHIKLTTKLNKEAVLKILKNCTSQVGDHYDTIEEE